MIAESARWGDFRSDIPKTTKHWEFAVRLVREQFFANRTPIVIEQLRQAKRWEFGRPINRLVEAGPYESTPTSTVGAWDVPETILGPNYPNPFAGETTLQFTTPQSASVRLDVFDVLGRRVETVTDQYFSRGAHQVRWDSGSLARGVYLVRMEVDGQPVGVRKIVHR